MQKSPSEVEITGEITGETHPRYQTLSRVVMLLNMKGRLVVRAVISVTVTDWAYSEFGRKCKSELTTPNQLFLRPCVAYGNYACCGKKSRLKTPV